MSQLESYNTDPLHPILIVLHHDGDNYGGGTDSYYGSNFDNFVSWLNANSNRFVCTTIQDYLDQFPPVSDDVIHVEAGSWSGAGSDPEFLKWNGDPVNGYSPDHNSWSVITAAANIIHTAEQINPASANTQSAWDDLMTGETSDYWYWDGTDDWDSKPTRASNMATSKAMTVVNSGTDLTPPSIYHPQREPYNPGATEWGIAMSSDFTVWTYVYDVSGLDSVKLKYRTDKDGINPVTGNQNETYAGGDEVNSWQELPMTATTIASATTLQPTYKADYYGAQIKGLKGVLVDYYVEATDKKGNVARSFISHVYVGTGSSTGGSTTNVSWTPVNPTTANTILITCKNATYATKLHWGVNGVSGTWQTPDITYQPTGTTAVTGAVETPFVLADSLWQVTIGPFNNAVQPVTSINFVINYGSNTWDNNNGNNYLIPVTAVATNNPVGRNIVKTLVANQSYTFATSDFGFNSSIQNTFNGIQIVSLPGTGTLKAGTTSVIIGQLINDITQLTFTAAGTTASFTFKIVDSAGLISDATYTATFTVGNTTATGITVAFKKPTDWSTSGVSIYAWTGTNTAVAGVWPGTAMTDNGNGWYAYTFDSSITNVNAIFSKNGSPQTVDITGITQSICYQQSGLSGTELTVVSVNCPATGISEQETVLKALVYPQPADNYFTVKLPDNIDAGNYRLSILDISGRDVRQKIFNGKQITVERGNLKTGLYIIHVMSENSGKEFSAKLSVE